MSGLCSQTALLSCQLNFSLTTAVSSLSHGQSVTHRCINHIWRSGRGEQQPKGKRRVNCGNSSKHLLLWAVTPSRKTQEKPHGPGNPTDVVFTTKSLLWVNSQQMGHQSLPVVAQTPDKYYPHARKSDNRVTHGTFSIWESEAGGFACIASRAGGTGPPPASQQARVLLLQTRSPHLHRGFITLRTNIFALVLSCARGWEGALCFPELLETSASILGRKNHFSCCLCSTAPHGRRAPGSESFRIFGASQKPFNYL